MAIIRYDDLANPPSYNGSPIRSATDIPEVPSAISELTNDSDFKTNAYHDSNKQNTISDLEDIRDGAEAGADAYQMPLGGIPKTDVDPILSTYIDSKIVTPSGGSTGDLLKMGDTGPEWGDMDLGGMRFELLYTWTNTGSNYYNVTNASPTVSGRSWSNYDIFVVFYSSWWAIDWGSYDSSNDVCFAFVFRNVSTPIRLAPQGFDPNRIGWGDYWRDITIKDAGMTVGGTSNGHRVGAIRAVYGIKDSVVADAWPL